MFTIGLVVISAFFVQGVTNEPQFALASLFSLLIPSFFLPSSSVTLGQSPSTILRLLPSYSIPHYTGFICPFFSFSLSLCVSVKKSVFLFHRGSRQEKPTLIRFTCSRSLSHESQQLGLSLDCQGPAHNPMPIQLEAKDIGNCEKMSFPPKKHKRRTSGK